MSETIIPYTFTDRLVPVTNTPEKAHADDAAYDLRAAEDCWLSPGDRVLVNTGIRLAIPKGFAGLVLPRSGLALKYGITVLNAPGLIDPGYRGEVGVILHNTTRPPWMAPHNYTPELFRINRGDRIAQLLFVGPGPVQLQYVTPRSFNFYLSSERGEGGFGSTGR